LLDEFSTNEYEKALDVDPLNDFIKSHFPKGTTESKSFLKEMVLWALCEYNQINKSRTELSTDFNDLFGNLLDGDSVD
ncbi:MAG TPA: magnesium chelatase, partial [Cryomorphaceae bacterium]|nr:magnesium chelatase [Cryomorphaceae bacterium]